MGADAWEGNGLCLRHRQQPSDQPHMGTAFNPAKTSPASWDAFSDVDAFVDAVLAELAAMAADGTRRLRSGPKPPLTGAALRKAILPIPVLSSSTAAHVVQRRLASAAASMVARRSRASRSILRSINTAFRWRS